MKIANTIFLALISAPSILACNCDVPVMVGEIRNTADKTQCVDANGSGEGDVGTYYCDAIHDQEFKFCSDGTIQSTKTGLCLTKEGQKFVKMSECSCPSVPPNQSWKIAYDDYTETDNDVLQKYFFLRNRDDNNCLDIAGSSGHGDIVTHRCEFWLSDQRMYVRGRGKVLGHGKLLNLKSNKCLDVAGRYGHGNVATYRCQDLADQVFTYYENGEMVNDASKECLSVTSSSGRGNIQIGPCYSITAQQWVQEAYGGDEDYFFLMNKDSGLCVDVAGDGGEGEIATFTCEYLQDQYWKWIPQEEVTRVDKSRRTKKLQLRNKEP